MLSLGAMGKAGDSTWTRGPCAHPSGPYSTAINREGNVQWEVSVPGDFVRASEWCCGAPAGAQPRLKGTGRPPSGPWSPAPAQTTRKWPTPTQLSWYLAWGLIWRLWDYHMGNFALTEMVLLKMIFSLSWQKFLSGLSIRKFCAFLSLVSLRGSANFVTEDVSLALRAR